MRFVTCRPNGRKQNNPKNRCPNNQANAFDVKNGIEESKCKKSTAQKEILGSVFFRRLVPDPSLQRGISQSERVGDDGDRAEGHSSCDDHGRKEEPEDGIEESKCKKSTAQKEILGSVFFRRRHVYRLVWFYMHYDFELTNPRIKMVDTIGVLKRVAMIEPTPWHPISRHNPLLGDNDLFL